MQTSIKHYKVSHEIRAIYRDRNSQGQTDRSHGQPDSQCSVYFFFFFFYVKPININRILKDATQPFIHHFDQQQRRERLLPDFDDRRSYMGR